MPILLRDSAHLAMRDAERANRDLPAAARRVEPLFDLEDVERDAAADQAHRL